MCTALRRRLGKRSGDRRPSRRGLGQASGRGRAGDRASFDVEARPSQADPATPTPPAPSSPRAVDGKTTPPKPPNLAHVVLAAHLRPRDVARAVGPGPSHCHSCKIEAGTPRPRERRRKRRQSEVRQDGHDHFAGRDKSCGVPATPNPTSRLLPVPICGLTWLAQEIPKGLSSQRAGKFGSALDPIAEVRRLGYGTLISAAMIRAPRVTFWNTIPSLAESSTSIDQLADGTNEVARWARGRPSGRSTTSPYAASASWTLLIGSVGSPHSALPQSPAGRHWALLPGACGGRSPHRGTRRRSNHKCQRSWRWRRSRRSR